MADLKTLRNRIKSVKSTQKITKAMKMVAAAKLKRAQDRAEAARPYAERMERMLSTVAAAIKTPETAPALLAGHFSTDGTRKDQVQLVIALSSDRGLCGGFNGSIARATRGFVRRLTAEGKTVKVITVGRKAYDLLRPYIAPQLTDRIEGISRKQVGYADAEELAQKILAMFNAYEIDTCTLVYNAFQSAIVQVVTFQQLIPLQLPQAEAVDTGDTVYDFEPEEEEILDKLLPQNLAVQIYHALLESAASEQGARMSAMDNATRNAGEMIKKLTLVYNRTRQATITKELIEIISGAEAV